MRPSKNLNNKILSDILKSSAGIYESSPSQFFRTTTRIQTKPNVLDDSMFVMAFFTILGVTEILCSLRLVLDGKTGIVKHCNEEPPKNLG